MPFSVLLPRPPRLLPPRLRRMFRPPRRPPATPGFLKRPTSKDASRGANRYSVLEVEPCSSDEPSCNESLVRSALFPPSLDEAEDIIPSTTVQAARMRTELKQNLLHLERSWQRLNQDRCADRARGDAAIRLSEIEDIGPKTSFKVVFYLGEVEVWSGAMREEVSGVVIEEQGEIED